ncbi:MAG: hypothetical protein KF774_12060 [Planctomyces sp.]|nr:hypothetical protein [Planctomyces sp.]
MHPDRLFERYAELQRYVGWSDAQAGLVASLRERLEPSFPALVEDFYAEIECHPAAMRVITGGPEQIQRLKGTLVHWLRELFSGRYDADYVARRWRIGYRHVEIGLDQVFTNVALSRLRAGLVDALERGWDGPPEDLLRAQRSLNTLIDLDLALIEDAYQTEFAQRQQAAERLALIGQVAGGVAHELRNPLNVIRTSAFYLLNARQPPPEKVRTHLERIERQVGLADGVIVSLVNFARMGAPERAPVDVLQLVRSTLETRELPAGVRTVVDCPDGLPQALVDASQLRIVLDNLVRNACEAMPEGGVLTLRGAAFSEFVDLSVSDTGKGMEPGTLARVMEPFFSTKARGMGLGLPMAKAIVEKNGGRLSAASTPGEGATFTVRLQTPGRTR